MRLAAVFPLSMALCSIAALNGCASGVLPIEPHYDRNALLARGTTLKEAVTVDEARKIAAAWSDQLQAATRDRRLQGMAAKEVLFYGSLLFTAGSVQMARQASETWRQVRNVGAGAAAGSELFGSHYQTNDQALAFKRAATQMGCLVEALQPIPTKEEYLKLFDTESKTAVNAALTEQPKDLDELYNAVPRKTLHFMEQGVLPRLQAELQAVQLGTPSREALTQLVDRYRSAQASGTAGSKAVDTPSPQALVAFNVQRKLRNAEASDLDSAAMALRRKEVVSALSSYAAQIELCIPK